MKNYFIITVICAAAMLACAVILIKPDAVSGKKSDHGAETTAEAVQDDGTVDVFLTETEKVQSVSYFEYTCASVAAEMPLTYHTEALKAQAVACFTNAVRLKKSTPTEKMQGADISDDPEVHQGFLSQSERKEKWGADYEKYEAKLEDAVNAVLGEIITFNGEPCTAAFSAICTGVTESAENVWGSAVPYLVSVKSSGDTLSPAYSDTKIFNRAQFAAATDALGITVNEKTDFAKELKITELSKAGTVLKMTVCGKEFSGAEIRDAFSLRSAAFEIGTAKNSVTFTVKGFGHGVGLSQYGADFMARQGSSYEEILKHYYKGVEIEKRD